MTRYLSCFSVPFVLFFCPGVVPAQSVVTDFVGGWKGEVEDERSFRFTVDIVPEGYNRYSLLVSTHDNPIFQRDFRLDGNRFHVAVGEGVSVHGAIDEPASAFTVFAESGRLVYRIPMQVTDAGAYRGRWKVWMVDALFPAAVYLSVQEDAAGRLVAYPFFGDRRFTGTWAHDFELTDNRLAFQDLKTGMSFNAELTGDRIDLAIRFAGTDLTRARLERYGGAIPEEYVYGPVSAADEIPRQRNDGWPVNGLEQAGIEPESLRRMAEDVNNGDIAGTHSILIAKDGELVYEKYFSGFDADTSHDQRSASKSISSALIGIAVDRQLIENADQPLFDFISAEYAYTKNRDERKSAITLHSLLTMSSGLDAIDYGTDRDSAAAEGNYQQSPDWLKTVLEAPMIHDPSTRAYYGSANPFLLGVALQSVVDGPVEYFMDEYLFQPLGIAEYIIQNDDRGQPYFGGGLYLRPRDMLKFGQLYLDKGTWQGRRIVSREWVDRSFETYGVLENTRSRSRYGYLWWHRSYAVDDRSIAAVEARGAGGQYISVFPELNAVTSITSGNFSNGRFRQPEAVIEDYILPAIIGRQSLRSP